MAPAQKATTNPLPADAWFACIYVTPGHEPMTALMKDPLPEFLEAEVQRQSVIQGVAGPMLQPPTKQRFERIVHFPAMRLAIYASAKCFEGFKERAAALEAEQQGAAEGAAEVVRDELGPTLAQIRRLPVARDPPAE